MTSFAGNFLGSTSVIEQPSNPDFGHLLEPNRLHAWRSSDSSWHAVTRHQPVAEFPRTLTGNIIKSFGFLDWYEQIHFSTFELDLGNVVSVQQRSVFIWNAFFVPRTLESIAATDDVGLVLTQPSPTPLTFAPLQELEYLLSVATDGPATIDANYAFAFDVGPYDLHVIGVRIVAWEWEANWVENVTERLAFNTDVLTNYDGSEQRMQLRSGPLASWEFTFDVSNAVRRNFENVVFAWGARNWALPIWTDVTHAELTLAAGSTFISLDPEGLDYHDGGLGVIIGDAGSEAFEVDSVGGGGITLSRPIIGTWPVGSRIYPGRTATMNDPRATGRMTRNYARGVATFTSIEEIVRDPLVETQYRNQPVMEAEPNWRDAPDLDYQRKLATLTFGTGRSFIDDEADLALPQQSFHWTMLTRADANYFRSWLYARQGKCRGFWLPTWSDDLVLTAVVSPSGVNLDFEACGLVHFAAGAVHRRDVRIQLTNGTVYYRRLTTPVTVDDNTERATMNAPFGVQVSPQDVERISWMAFVRLDVDTVEITWQSAGTAEAAIVTKAPRNDV